MIKNEPEQIELRRNQNTLIITGTGMIVFMLWSMVKAFWLLFIRRTWVLSELSQRIDDMGFDHSHISDDDLFLVLLIIVAGVLLVDLLIKLFVGRSAISEGKGKNRGWFYVILTWLLIVSSVLRMFEAKGTYAGEASLNGVLSSDGSLSSMIIELTCLIMMIQMAVASMRVKKARRQKAENAQEGVEHAD